MTGIAVGAFLIGAAALQASESSLLLHAQMKDVVAPQTQILWDMGNKGMDDDGNPDASKLMSADWAQITSAAQKIRAAANDLAGAQRIIVAAPGAKLQDEGATGASTAPQIQAYIDKDRKAFADHARSLAAVSNDFIEAAAARDAARLMAASDKVNAVCEACHAQFWYPQQAGATQQ
jgi:hypothetical protein